MILIIYLGWLEAVEVVRGAKVTTFAAHVCGHQGLVPVSALTSWLKTTAAVVVQIAVLALAWVVVVQFVVYFGFINLLNNRFLRSLFCRLLFSLFFSFLRSLFCRLLRSLFHKLRKIKE